jgi:stage V sporulation protein R
MPKKTNYLATGTEWDVSLIENAWPVIDKLGQKYGWKGYKPQFEIITYDQMLECYATVGMPCCYDHWSVGKRYTNDMDDYKKGLKGLAYEMIINTDPAICYLMENNSACMQLLVMAHAAVGHSHFFKHNYLFKEWTDATHILDYMVYAKRFIARCEEKYGNVVVENILDAAHSIQLFSIDKYQRRSKTIAEEKDRLIKRLQHQDEFFNAIFDDTQEYSAKTQKILTSLDKLDDNIMPGSRDTDENLLRIIAKNAAHLRPWMKEVLNIVSNIGQYFYPQYQDKVMNEGFASMAHYTLMNDMFDNGLISEGYILEFLDSHSGVTFQPAYNQKSKRGHSMYSGINPYALGFNVFMDIKRICQNPDDEDKRYFSEIAGKDWVETVNFVVENFKDETFIQQYLSPKIIRKMGLFVVAKSELQMDYSGDLYKDVLITGTEADKDYQTVKESLAKQYSLSERLPILDARIDRVHGVKHLAITHHMRHNGDHLHDSSLGNTLELIAMLWGGQMSFCSTKMNGKTIIQSTMTRLSGDERMIYKRRF